jgi:Tfp pilus assembly protein FimT
MMARNRRNAFSLFETILVMGVLVMSAAMVYPSLRGMYSSYKIQGAVDSVRAAWAMARARAIEEGQPYRFAIEPNGQYFRVAPDTEEFWAEASPGASTGKGGVYQQALPSGVRFSISGENVTPPKEDISSTREVTAPPSGSWTKVVTFLADGTAREDVRILFQARGARPTQLQLRGLTGSVSVIYQTN